MRAGNISRAVDVACAIGTSIHLIRPSQTQVIEQALTLAEEDSADFGRLNVALANSVGFMGQHDRAIEAYAKAEVIAKRVGLRELELQILRGSQYVIGFQFRLWEAVAIGDRGHSSGPGAQQSIYRERRPLLQSRPVLVRESRGGTPRVG